MANDADTSELLPFICSVAGTTSQPASPQCATLGCWIQVLDAGQGDEGIGGYRKPGHPLGNSLRMLPVMPRRLGTHRTSWITQEQGLSPGLRLRQVWFEMGAGGWGLK